MRVFVASTVSFTSGRLAQGTPGRSCTSFRTCGSTASRWLAMGLLTANLLASRANGTAATIRSLLRRHQAPARTSRASTNRRRRVVHPPQPGQLPAVDGVLVVAPAASSASNCRRRRGERQVVAGRQEVPAVLVPVQPQAHAALGGHVADRAPSRAAGATAAPACGSRSQERVVADHDPRAGVERRAQLAEPVELRLADLARSRPTARSSPSPSSARSARRARPSGRTGSVGRRSRWPCCHGANASSNAAPCGPRRRTRRGCPAPRCPAAGSRRRRPEPPARPRSSRSRTPAWSRRRRRRGGRSRACANSRRSDLDHRRWRAGTAARGRAAATFTQPVVRLPNTSRTRQPSGRAVRWMSLKWASLIIADCGVRSAD